MTGTTTNDLVELTGSPMLSTTNGSTFQNSVIILDRANGKIIAPGKYLIRGVQTAGATGAAPLLRPNPKKKRGSVFSGSND